MIAAVAGHGNIWTSTDAGTTWTEDSSVGNSKAWQSIAVSGDASTIVAVALNANIWLSTDSGATFLEQAVGATEEWTDVAVSADGSKMIASVRNGGKLWRSTDSGSSWSQLSVGASDLTSFNKGGHVKLWKRNGCHARASGKQLSVGGLEEH